MNFPCNTTGDIERIDSSSLIVLGIAIQGRRSHNKAERNLKVWCEL